jgi:hypothetical protein
VVFAISIFLLNIFFVIKENWKMAGPDNYYTKKKAVDKIYQLAQGKPFKVYIYNQTIYDYPFQYFFSYYGNKKYLYIPVDYSYLPNQPEYVLKKEFFDRNKKTRLSQNQPLAYIFLILDPDSHLTYTKESWMDNFKNYQVIKRIEFANKLEILQLTAEKLEK